MAIGRVSRQARFDDPVELLGSRLTGVYALFAGQGDRMFAEDYFVDLYKDSKRGRPTVPARVLATVMLLQSHEGLSDRDAVTRVQVDLRWQAAAGVHTGYEGFHPTVLVGMRNRLRASERPRRLFEDTRVAARQARAMGDKVRVLDSTPVFDAVATQDTVTQVRSAIRGVLRATDNADRELATALRAVLRRDDAYATPGKPPCDWDDRAAREQLVDELVRDAIAASELLDGRVLDGALKEAAELLAIVSGQDIEEGHDGTFRIRRGVARDRLISTVDPEARHGRKSSSKTFDGYKAHLSVDPESELIDEVVVTPANAHDAEPVDELLEPTRDLDDKPAMMGDAAYGDGDTRERLAKEGREVIAKVPPASNRGGRFSKDDFTVDTDAGSVTCPAGHTVPITPAEGGGGLARFRKLCASCPLLKQCTTARDGRTINIHRHEAVMQHARAEQKTRAWRETYTKTRPRVERKIADFVQSGWGSRRARVRGKERIQTDIDTRAAIVNWKRLSTLGATLTTDGWTLQPAT